MSSAKRLLQQYRGQGGQQMLNASFFGFDLVGHRSASSNGRTSVACLLQGPQEARIVAPVCAS